MIRIIELFGGIGAFTKAFKRQGLPIEVLDYVEIDKYAVASYNAINGTNFEPQDIKEWNKHFENVDFIIHGSPCQDFSVAGKQAGGDKGSGTRSSLLYETLRIVGNNKPRYVIWENVKGILSPKHRHNFDEYLEEMSKLGYNNFYQILNSKDYGVPQNRERVFTVSIRKDISDNEFIFPARRPITRRLKDVLEKEVDEKYYLSDKSIANYNRKFGSKGKMQSPNDVCSTLQAAMGNGGGNVPIIVASRGRGENNEQHLEPRKDGLTNTITSVQKDNYVATPYRIRKLTPKECWRLMGFDDSDFEKAEKVNSNTQLYKQAGNSIVVNVAEAIISRKELVW